MSDVRQRCRACVEHVDLTNQPILEKNQKQHRTDIINVGLKLI